MTRGSHRRTLSAAAAVVLAALAWTPLGAQAWSAPAVGERVRIMSPVVSPKALTGELVEVRGDTLVVLSDVSLRRLEIPLAQVVWLEVRRPRPRLDGLGKSLLYSVPIGFGSGYLYGWMLEGGFNCKYECGFAPVVLSVGGAALGTVVGTIVGLAAPGGRWVTVPRSSATGSGGMALSIAIQL